VEEHLQVFSNTALVIDDDFINQTHEVNSGLCSLEIKKDCMEH